MSFTRKRKLAFWSAAALLALTALTIAGWYIFFPSLELPEPPYNQGGLHGGFIGKDHFITGANYPWINYGGDFGANAWGHNGLSESANQKQLDADFAWFEEHHITVVRMFLFGDGRAGLVFNPDGRSVAMDAYVFKDMDVLVDTARKHHLMLILVMFDFGMFGKSAVVSGVQTGGHTALITSEGLRQSLMEQVVKPLLERYRNNGAIVAWEVVNEPEWVMQVRGGGNSRAPVAKAQMVDFVRQVVDYIHKYSAQAATVGSARRNFVRIWLGVGLDFYQYHYYPYMEPGTRYNYAAKWLNLDAPCIIGELPTNDPRAYTHYLDLALANGYSGAFGWSLNATDRYSQLRARAPQIDAWQAQHPTAMRP